jgi:hypothetical protein
VPSTFPHSPVPLPPPSPPACTPTLPGPILNFPAPRSLVDSKSTAATDSRAMVIQGSSSLATYWSKGIVYCCNRLCSTTAEALGQALGYAAYAEVVFCALAVCCYLAIPRYRKENEAVNRMPLHRMLPLLAEVAWAQEQVGKKNEKETAEFSKVDPMNYMRPIEVRTLPGQVQRCGELSMLLSAP